MAEQNWDNLPDHILVNIFSFLSLTERVQAGYVCKSWQDCFNSPYLWKRFVFRFFKSEDQRLLKCLKKHGPWLRHLNILLDQEVKINRDNLCETLSWIANMKERRIQSLRIYFCGENPLFYAGVEIANLLHKIFKPDEDVETLIDLKEVDLGGLGIAFDDNLFNLLAGNNQNLQRLNIQNKSLICKVTPACVINIIKKCKKLKDLRLFYTSMSDEVLEALCAPDRRPLEYLSLLCTRTEKFGKVLSKEAWMKLTKASPNLKVGLQFDHTIPVHKIWEITIPQIPLYALRFETFTELIEEVEYVTATFHKTLQKISLHTPPGDKLERALLNLVASCNLKALYVFCVLSEETIDKILETRPELKERKSYVLKHTKDPLPWVKAIEIEQVFQP
ncbi:F-box/LRR-repeat protein 8-like [Lineus longissimus]|uniref:F-box/LRR-repeat protein 8-like n=1 Tax=Lineus longissimus TaxID=88925 RepID=UPI00315DECD4